MRLTIESGQISARQQALAATSLYREAVAKFGRTLDPYNGDAPKSLGISHLLRVNSSLETAPTPSTDRRRGFMFATVKMAEEAGVSWEKLDEPLTCAYVWGRDINSDSKNLYAANKSLFVSPNSDFWKCAYLKHVLGDTAFAMLWQSRDKTQATNYDALLYAVNNLTRSLPGWPIIKLRKTVLVDCAYVYELAKRGGGLTSSGYGIQPVLRKSSYEQVFEQ